MEPKQNEDMMGIYRGLIQSIIMKEKSEKNIKLIYLFARGLTEKK